MPLHRHECESCGNRFRVLVLPGTEGDIPTCPACGSTSSHRLMPLVAVQFKGSGFYKTDHGSKDRSRGKQGSKSEASGSGEATSSADSKASDTSKPARDSKTSSVESSAD